MMKGKVPALRLDRETRRVLQLDARIDDDVETEGMGENSLRAIAPVRRQDRRQRSRRT